MMFREGTPDKFSLRYAVIAALVAVCLFIAAVAAALQFYFSHQLVTSAAQKLYSTKAVAIEERFRELDRRSISDMGQFSNLLGMERIAESSGQDPVLRIVAEHLRQESEFKSIYYGNGNGELIQLVSLQAVEKVGSVTQGKPGERWVLVTVAEFQGQWLRRSDYLDDQLNFLRRVEEATDYRATDRPWYIAAMQSRNSEVIKTKLYDFARWGGVGISYAKRVGDSDDVVGGDVTLAGLSKFLGRYIQSGSDAMAFVFKGDGSIYARSDFDGSTDVDTLSAPWFNPEGLRERRKLLSELAATAPEMGAFRFIEIEGQNVYIYIKPIKSRFSDDDFFGFILPASELVNPYLQTIAVSVVITILVVLCLIPLAYWLASRLVKPVDALNKFTNLISDRKFSEITLHQTRIYEYHRLSQSLVSMADDISQYQRQQKQLIDAIIELIAGAIDEKSPYTGGHCERVPEIGIMLAEKAHESQDPLFKEFRFANDSERREFRVAAWLHDCGKITTPEHVVDKGTKLETIYNRIHEVRMRFEILWRDAEISMLKKLMDDPESEPQLRDQRNQAQEKIREDFAFIAECNKGSEFMSPEDLERIEVLSQQVWQRNLDDSLGLSGPELARYNDSGDLQEDCLPVSEFLLSDKQRHIIERKGPLKIDPEMGINMTIPEHLYNLGELHNLKIRAGTLTAEDRFKINEHIISTIRMLESLPFTDDLARVPRYASTHHEWMNGNGYPRGLKIEALSIPERILAIADVFEALTASDRPYKKAKSLSEALKIMSFMVKDGHLDGDLFRLFLESGCCQVYAEKYLSPEQVDEVNIQSYL